MPMINRPSNGMEVMSMMTVSVIKSLSPVDWESDDKKKSMMI